MSNTVCLIPYGEYQTSDSVIPSTSYLGFCFLGSRLVSMHIYIYIYTSIHTYMHTYIHTYTYIYIYILTKCIILAWDRAGCLPPPHPARRPPRPPSVLGSWGNTMRDAVRNKERWKRCRTPTQDPSTNFRGASQGPSTNAA